MDAIDKMKAEREEYGKREKIEASMYTRMMQYNRERFDKAETQLYFMSDQNIQDTYFVQNNIFEWLTKAKDGSTQKKTLDDMSVALVRMNAYTITVETSAKAAVAAQIRDAAVLKKLESDLRVKDLEIMKMQIEPQRLQKEIETLKQQLKFHEEAKG